MGYAIAEAALKAGHDVKLISGPASIAPPAGARFIQITTSDELHDEVHRAIRECDVLVMCAAVADYKPAKIEPRKMKKARTPFALELVPTRDILASLPQTPRALSCRRFRSGDARPENQGAEETPREEL